MKTKDVKQLTAFQRLIYWISERHNIFVKKSLRRKAPPWTDDEILQNYRFCNVYREYDAVTKWIRINWREPHSGDHHLWFAMLVARLFNLPSTLEHIGYQNAKNFRPANLLDKLLRLKESGVNVFNAAYIVSTNGLAMGKCDYVISRVMVPAWHRRDSLAPREGDTLESFAARLETCNGLGTFIAAQVVADVKHAAKSPLADAEDWWTWAAPGPGSKRGLNRVNGREHTLSMARNKFNEDLAQLRKKVLSAIKIHGLRSLSAQDLQNCLCEFDKYERALWGQGKPKRKYQGV